VRRSLGFDDGPACGGGGAFDRSSGDEPGDGLEEPVAVEDFVGLETKLGSNPQDQSVSSD
jgi:hypothetical protein